MKKLITYLVSQLGGHSGFTLLELIVSVGVIALLSTVLSQVFFVTLRGNTKTGIIKDVKQNGEFALETMVRMIQNAQKITSTCSAEGTTSQAITFLNPDGGTTTFGCNLDGVVTRIASTSALGTSFLSGGNVTLGGSNCSGSSLQFVCKGTSGVTSTLTISFNLAQKGTPLDQFEKGSASFQTSVVTRNVTE